MSFKNKIRSQILSLLISPTTVRVRRWWVEKRRRLSGRRHIVSVFLQIDDPYSYILSHYLLSLAAHYDIELKVFLSQSKGGEYQPEPQMLAEYAIADCVRLAHELGIPFLDKGQLPPTESRAGLSDAVAELVGSECFAERLFEALTVYWRGDAGAAAEIAQSVRAQGAAKAVVLASQQMQQRQGHYASATLHYGGEWYWGIDRLHFLTDRLDSLGVARHENPDPRLESILQVRNVSLPIKPPSAAAHLPPLEFFFSFRSPYSYLALRRIFEIGDAFGLQVKVRPVLPMVMRGMQIPRQKMMYIARDTGRIAQQIGLPFGKFADPVGHGIERCLAVFVYAEAERRGRDFVLNAGHAIWAAATDLATDKGMRKVTGKTGLFWPDVEKAMQSEGWRDDVEANRKSMLASGSWGVPTIRLGEWVLWGQDRDWLLIRHIEELCDTGDGILV